MKVPVVGFEHGIVQPLEQCRFSVFSAGSQGATGAEFAFDFPHPRQQIFQFLFSASEQIRIADFFLKMDYHEIFLFMFAALLSLPVIRLPRSAQYHVF